MPTFDIVSEVDKHVLTNSVDQSNRLISNRFDFKGVEASFELNDFVVTMWADAEFQVQQMLEVLQTNLHKNKIDISCLELKKLQQAGKQVKREVLVRNGLESELSKKIIKLIKDKKLKVQAQIQGDQIRVTGKKRDDLQSVIAMLRDSDIEMPLQFINFRD